jgi:hypothetical protein
MTASMEEIQRAGILSELLKFISTPKTIEQIAHEFTWHPQTARRYVWALRDSGRAKEATRKDGRKSMWQASANAGTTGEVLLVTSHETIQMSRLLMYVETRRATGNAVAGALAYLYRRAYYKSRDQSDVLNVARQGTLDPLLEVKKLMQNVYLAHDTYNQILEQLLLDLPALWEDGTALLDMMGDVSLEELEATASEFETWARSILG